MKRLLYNQCSTAVGQCPWGKWSIWLLTTFYRISWLFLTQILSLDLSWSPELLVLRQLGMSIFPHGTNPPAEPLAAAPRRGGRGQTPAKAGLFFLWSQQESEHGHGTRGDCWVRRETAFSWAADSWPELRLALGVYVCAQAAAFVWDHLRISLKRHHSAHLTLSDKSGLVVLCCFHLKLKKWNESSYLFVYAKTFSLYLEFTKK